MEIYKLYKIDHYNCAKEDSYFYNIEKAKESLINIFAGEKKKFFNAAPEEIDVVLKNKFHNSEIIERDGCLVGFKPVNPNTVMQYRHFYNIRNKHDNKKTVFSEYIIDVIEIPGESSKNTMEETSDILKLCKYSKFNYLENESYYTDIKNAFSNLSIDVKDECEKHNLPDVKEVQEYIKYNFRGAEIIHNGNTLIGFKPLLDDIKLHYINFYYDINQNKTQKINYSEYIIKNVKINQ